MHVLEQFFASLSACAYDLVFGRIMEGRQKAFARTYSTKVIYIVNL
jgi:hypothetical protein